jgi:hypothetical protein
MDLHELLKKLEEERKTLLDERANLEAKGTDKQDQEKGVGEQKQEPSPGRSLAAVEEDLGKNKEKTDGVLKEISDQEKARGTEDSNRTAGKDIPDGFFKPIDPTVGQQAINLVEKSVDYVKEQAEKAADALDKTSKDAQARYTVASQEFADKIDRGEERVKREAISLAKEFGGHAIGHALEQAGVDKDTAELAKIAYEESKKKIEEAGGPKNLEALAKHTVQQGIDYVKDQASKAANFIDEKLQEAKLLPDAETHKKFADLGEKQKKERDDREDIYAKREEKFKEKFAGAPDESERRKAFDDQIKQMKEGLERQQIKEAQELLYREVRQIQ